MTTQDTAVATPTKRFFVSMLTRDISLVDAILDLVDNCLDGALRLAGGEDVDYSQYLVEIKLDDEIFSIKDNCGGIPRDIAKNYAFKMGREPDDNRDSERATIGMYGVGMKRAIFKMGDDAKVQTLCGKDAFEVPITAEWLGDKDWKALPIRDTAVEERLSSSGTHIRVNRLYPGVSKHFSNDGFKNELRTALSEHFTMFLQRGLRISVDDVLIEAVHVEVLVSDGSSGPVPYVFQQEVEGVNVLIAVGLNTAGGFDDDESLEIERDRSAATAGWTVFCNDRAVIVGDKSRLTGWGDSIPLYHNQFSIITGIVEFRSNQADQLPITTTKRALDTSSDIWLQALVKMKEGMRVWINYTNAWKNHPRSDQTEHWKSARLFPLREAAEMVFQREKGTNGKIITEYNPQKQKVLPSPPTKKPSSRKIVFSRPIEDIRLISKSLFDSEDEKPGIVGDECFEQILQEVRKKDATNE